MSAAYDDGGWAVAWADQRRFPVQGVPFSDVWVVTQKPDGGLSRFEGNSLSSAAVRDNALLAANGSQWLVGWSELDAGWALKGRLTIDTSFDNGWQAETTLASPTTFDHGTDLVAGGGGQWRMSWRKASALWVQYGATGAQLTTMPGILDVSLIDVPGDFLIAYLAPNNVFTHLLSTMGSAPVSSTVSQSRHIALSAQSPQVVHQTSAGDITFFVRTASALSPVPTLTITGSIPSTPLLSTGYRTGTLITYLDANGSQLRLVTPALGGTATSFAAMGGPIALVSDPTRQRALLVEQGGGGVWARNVVDGSPPTVSSGVTTLNVLPRPQQRPTVAWSETKQAFLVMWDELVPPAGGALMYSYLFVDGGVTDPQQYGGVVDGGARPRLIPGLGSDPLGLLRYDGPQFFDTLNETTSPLSATGSITVPGNLTYATRGSRTLAWGPRGTASVDLSVNWGAGSSSFLQPMPRCAALKTGQFWFGPITGGTQWTMAEAAGAPMFSLNGPPISGQGQHCYAVRPVHDTVVVGYHATDGGIRLMTVEPPFVDVVAPRRGSGSPLVNAMGSNLLVSWVEPPAAVKGFVVRPDGGVFDVAIDDTSVDGREHWAASSSNGSVAVVWQSFDVASGRVLVNARVVSELTLLPSFDAGVSTDAGLGVDGGSTIPDGGTPDTDGGASVDGGSTGLDAGADTDGGPPDAGGSDAGEADAGARDGGRADAGPTPDAGVADGGASDAGPADDHTFVPVCGCDGASGAPLLLLAVMVMCRRRRAPSA